MQQLIQLLPNESESCGVKAVAPVSGQSYIDVVAASGTGATPTDLFTPLATGDNPYHAGQVVNNTCADIQVTANYLIGGDCDSCTVDTITTSPVTYVIRKGQVRFLPTGLISSASFVTGDWVAGVFTPSDLASDGTVEWDSHYQPCACGASVLVP